MTWSSTQKEYRLHPGDDPGGDQPLVHGRVTVGKDREDVPPDVSVAVARQVGERIGKELGFPVYLYEEAAARPERRNLAQVRKGSGPRLASVEKRLDERMREKGE